MIDKSLKRRGINAIDVLNLQKLTYVIFMWEINVTLKYRRKKTQRTASYIIIEKFEGVEN